MAEINEQIVRPYRYSVKLEVNAKGYVQPSIHIYDDRMINNEGTEISALAPALLAKVIMNVRGLGLKVATDIPDVEKLV